MTRALRSIGLLLLLGVCLFLIGRAAIEPFVVDPGDVASYRGSWGGPSYAGVLAVHCVPGVLAAGLLVWLARRRAAGRAQAR